MPNWSSTKIELNGKKETLDKLYEQMTKIDEETDKPKALNVCSCVEPTDDEDYNNMTDSSGASITGNWLNWRHKHWGTKWNVELNVIDMNSETTLTLEFESAWSGPNIWFTTICEELNLNGVYIDTEGGMDFCHVVEYKDGVVSDVEDNYISELSVSTLGKDWILDNIVWVLDENYATEEELLEEHDNLLCNLGAAKTTLEEFYEYAENTGYTIQWRIKGEENVV